MRRRDPSISPKNPCRATPAYWGSRNAVPSACHDPGHVDARFRRSRHPSRQRSAKEENPAADSPWPDRSGRSGHDAPHPRSRHGHGRPCRIGRGHCDDGQIAPLSATEEKFGLVCNSGSIRPSTAMTIAANLPRGHRLFNLLNATMLVSRVFDHRAGARRPFPEFQWEER